MNKKILIIDDDPAFREMVSIALREKMPDLQIDEARDGHVGEKKLRETRYDLILLDYRLPFGMDGLRFLEKTEGLRLNTPLIMITGEGNEDVAARAFRLGVTDYLVKKKNLLYSLQSKVEEIFNAEESDVEQPRKHASLSNAASSVEFIRNYREEMPSETSPKNSMGEAVMIEFDNVEEFNKFSSFVKRIDGVKIQDVRILENKFVFMLSLLPSRFEKMGKVFVTG
ncbi:MAG: response regulator [Candidatus Thermoplasmatota archaeon]|nr:response regulator [Euryarchaeota archaeon]MBU4032171.1 response regulator [Candidatus Thermoplasmatota archaeon]MBU4071037.1 response regulator [Candidatus Thermoplasmatota archaeon]MBU4145120.1 response regulator [Candidatus Thermoplasmatota archaeon]MBU4591026.1 response regulator [Candidatus Thermoplasmatota archaeon]